MKNGNRISKNRVEYVYGRLPSLNALSQNKVKAIYLQHGFKDEKILDEISKTKLTPKYLDLNALNNLARSGNHQGIIVEVAPHEYSPFDEIIANAISYSVGIVDQKEIDRVNILNATKEKVSINEISEGQEVIIVIGEKLESIADNHQMRYRL